MRGKHFKMNKRTLRILDITATASAYIVLVAVLFFIFRTILREIIDFSLSNFTVENWYLLIVPLFFAIYVVAKFVRIKSPYADELKKIEEDVTEKNS